MNIDFRVKEVGAETYEVTINVATREGLGTLLGFLMSQTLRKPVEPPPTAGKRE